jgi:syntaxin 1B/2/3
MIHDYNVQGIEDRSEQTKKNTEAANMQMTKGISSARRARKMKWCCCCFFLLILIAVAVVLIYCFVIKKNQDKEKENGGVKQ